jgi:DNA-directed RNA polymerase specialized sigma24 family protein
MPANTAEITRLLKAWGRGDAGAIDRLTPLVYDDALNTLAQMDPRRAQVVELRYFGGLTVEEIGHVLKISPQSVMRDWKLAHAWLARELSR